MNYRVARNNERSHPSSAGQGLFAQMKLSEMLVRLEELLEATKPATGTIAAKQRAGCDSLNPSGSGERAPGRAGAHTAVRRGRQPRLLPNAGQAGDVFVWSQLSIAPPSSYFLEIKEIVSVLCQLSPPLLPDGSSFGGIGAAGEAGQHLTLLPGSNPPLLL